MAVRAGIAEAGGGILLALGLLTPLACTAIAIMMLNAIFAVTLKRAFLLGSELELMYLVTAIALAAIGPGRFSLDRAIGWDDSISGVWWGVLALGAAAVVSFATLALFHSKPQAQAAAAA